MMLRKNSQYTTTVTQAAGPSWQADALTSKTYNTELITYITEYMRLQKKKQIT